MVRNSAVSLDVSTAEGRERTSNPAPYKPETTKAQELEQTSTTGRFDWERQWYPMAHVDDLDPRRPHAIQLLGKELVLWRDGEGHWRCFEDRCPHRLAPLSEGRIEKSTGNLMCSYHGWQFQGEGKCTDIPQAIDPKAAATATSSPRACATPHPTQVLQGKVWVWGAAGPTASLESAAKVPPIVEELDINNIRKSAVPGWRVIPPIVDTYRRDFLYSWDTMAENLLDPAHINWAHHGVIGDREAKGAGHLTMCEVPATAVLPKANDGQRIAKLAHVPPTSWEPKQENTMSFVPPSYLRWMEEESGKGEAAMTKSLLVGYLIPTAPGRMRILFQICLLTRARFTILDVVFGLRPKWVAHLNANRVFDGDSVLLYLQEQAMKRNPAWKKSFYMPTSADSAIAEFRTRLDEWGKPVPDDSSPPERRQEVLLNRWEQHTKDCPTCLRALKNFKLIRLVSFAAALLIGCVGLATLLPGSPVVLKTSVKGTLAAAAVVAIMVGTFCSRTIPKFYFTGYSHPDT